MKTHDFRSVAFLPLVCLLGISSMATAQEVPPKTNEETDSRVRSIFQDVQDVNVVNVDVIVTDRDGRPVSDLTAADFELYEDGERVELDNFYAVEGGEATSLEGALFRDETTTRRDAVGRAPGRLAEEPEDTEPRRPLHLIVYVDNVQLQKAHRDRALAHLREVLEERTLQEDTRVMLVSNDRGIHFRHGFTGDRETIFHALDELEKEPTYGFFDQQELRSLVRGLADLNADAGNMAMGDLRFGDGGVGSRNPAATGGGGGGQNLGTDAAPVLEGNPREMQEFVAGQAQGLLPQMVSYAQRRSDQLEGTVGVLRSFVDHVAGLPGRKAVLYVSGGLSLNPAEALFEAYERRVAGMALVGQRANLGREVGRFDVSRDFSELVERANAGGVTFYAIDASPPSILSRGDATSGAGGTGSATARFSSQVDTIEERNRHESLELVAEGTGGRVALSSADLDRALESFFVDFENFYSLGYVAEDTPPDRTRSLEVKLSREARDRLGKGVGLRYRNQVRDKTVAEKMAERTMSALMMDVHDNPLKVELEAKEQTAVDDGKYAVPVIIRVPLGKLVLLPGERQHEARVNIYVAVLDEKGRTSPVARQACPIRVPNEELLVALGQDAGCGVRLLMRKGRQRIAVGIRDELAAVSSTVYMDLEVPGEPQTASVEEAEGAATR